jgi:hypothetical protein
VLPILVLCYIRIDSLRKTIESIQHQPHGPIYISCDGAPDAYKKESLVVQNYVRHLQKTGVVQDIQISVTNGGLLDGVSKGIDWFFKQVEVCIIIEDDLILEPLLLEAAEIVSTHIVDPNVISIGFSNYVPKKYHSDKASYYRGSRFTVSCGWLTTRREWNSRIKTYERVNFKQLFLILIKNIGFSSTLWHIAIYINQKNLMINKPLLCSWDHLWQLNCFVKNKKALNFNVNLINNIGFGDLATNTKIQMRQEPIDLINRSNLEKFKFKNQNLRIDMKADKYYLRHRKISKYIRAKLALKIRLKLRSVMS